jgi:hypothetical protein
VIIKTGRTWIPYQPSSSCSSRSDTHRYIADADPEQHGKDERSIGHSRWLSELELGVEGGLSMAESRVGVESRWGRVGDDGRSGWCDSTSCWHDERMIDRVTVVCVCEKRESFRC